MSVPEDEPQPELSYEEQVTIYKEQLALHEKSLAIARENRKTAELEYDKLIVALAGGGLTLTIGFVKDVVPLPKATHFPFLLATWIAFTLSLLTNLGSHRLTVLASDSFLVDSPKWRIYNRITTWANWMAMILLVLGVGSFVTFVSINLPQMKEADKSRPAPTIEQPHSDDLSKGLTFPADTAGRPLAPTAPTKPVAPKK
jgi:hypothetical protein